MSAVILTLPYPPTANHLFANSKSGGRFKTAHYKAWATQAGWEARQQRAGKIAGPYALYITACRPDARKRDLDNLAKPISDLLKELGVIESDHLCQRLDMRWSGRGKTVLVNVIATVEAA